MWGFQFLPRGPRQALQQALLAGGVCKVMKGSCQEHICHLFVKNPARRPVRSCDAGRAPPGSGGSLSCLSLAPSADKSQARRGATLWRSCCPLPAVWPHPVPCRAGLWALAPAIPFVHSLWPVNCSPPLKISFNCPEVTPLQLHRTATSQLPNCSAGIFTTAFICHLVIYDTLVSAQAPDSTTAFLSESSAPQCPGNFLAQCGDLCLVI